MASPNKIIKAMNPKNPDNNNTVFITLWTWQNENLNLADTKQMINSHEHSPYNHRKAYEKVHQNYSDQIIWCWNDFEASICYSSILEFKGQNRLLWELAIPEDRVFWYCPVAWEKIRTGELKKVGAMGEVIKSQLSPDFSQKLFKDFESFWSDKNGEELLNLMYLKRHVSLILSNSRILSCSGSIVKHPITINGGRITKNPLETKDWWPKREKIYQPVKNILPNDIERLIEMKPCLNCSGRS